MAKRISLIVMVLMVVSGCAFNQGIEGNLDGSTYTNDYFDLTFTIPQGWSTSTKQEVQRAVQAGAEILGSDNEDTGKKLEEVTADEKLTDLVMVRKYPKSCKAEFNTSFNLTASDVGAVGWVSSFFKKSPTIYLEGMSEQLARYGLNVKFTEPTERKIGKTRIASSDGMMEYNAKTIKYRYLLAIKRNHALTFTFCYIDDADLKIYESIIDSIEFKS